MRVNLIALWMWTFAICLTGLIWGWKWALLPFALSVIFTIIGIAEDFK